MDLILQISAAELEAGNDPIVEHGLKLLATMQADADSVTFGVQYELVDATAPDEGWSSVDIVTVTRDGEISA